MREKEIIWAIAHYRELCEDVYSLKSNWLVDLSQAGRREQCAVWEDKVCWKIDLDMAIKRLTKRQRYVLLRYLMRGRTQEEIAEELGITQPVVNEHFYAAIKKIIRLVN